MKPSLVSLFLFLSYLLVILVPSFGSFDIIGPQWFIISLLNLLSFVHILIFLNFNESLKTFKKDTSVRILLSFFILAFVSLAWSSNWTLWLQDISRLFSFILMTFSMIFLLKSFKVKIIPYFFLLVLSIESIWSMWYFLESFVDIGFSIFDAESFDVNFFKGVAGNKNITAASLLLKFAFSTYFLFSKNVHTITRIGAFLILTLSLISVFILSARASFVSLILISIYLTIIFFLDFLKSKKMNVYGLILYFSIIFCAFIISNSFLPDSSNKTLERVASIELSNQSSSNRLELWQNVFDQLQHTPLLGVGLGSWKIVSAKYWSNYGGDYLVPYHAHNDFLEVLVELGILGGIFYGLYFSISFFRVFLNYIRGNTNPILLTSIILSFIVYFVDAFFNFPYERPIMQSSLSVLLALSFYYNTKDFYAK